MVTPATPPPAPADQQPVAHTGVPGLDEILDGGLPAHRVYLLEGAPGTGKTTLAMQFLREGVRRGDSCLYVTLSETHEELRAVAHSHGWTLDGIEFFELTPSEALLGGDDQYTIFRPAEVELSDTVKAVAERVERLNPARVVIDALSELRLLAREPIHYRRQILALKQFFIGRRSTVLLLDDRTVHRPDLQVQSVAHGVILLEHVVAHYGEERRRLHITKLRGVKYKGGYHDARIERGGIRIYPRIVAAEHPASGDIAVITSGIEELDRLLGGGLSSGTSTLVLGPSGVGKTVLAARYAAVMGQAGGPAALYLFDERLNTFLHRARRLGSDLLPLIEERTVTVRQLDPGQTTPGEMADAIRRQVEDEGVRFVLIDSLNGYLNAMEEHAAVLVQLHELLSYLNNRGVATMITVAQHGILGAGIVAPLDVSYLADTLILMRFFEAEGAVHKAISVVKKRTGSHEHTIREFEIGDDQIRVGPPLTAFHGVLTGVPRYVGGIDPLLSKGGDGQA